MRKIKGLFKDKSSKPFQLGDVTFYLKPLTMSLIIFHQTKLMSGQSNIFTKEQKKEFALSCITGWDNMLFDDSKSECFEYSINNSIDLMTDESYDDVFDKLFSKSYSMYLESTEKQIEDEELVKK